MAGKTVGSGVVEPRKAGRGCCGVRWADVFRYQTYGAFCVLLAACILLGITHYLKQPTVRPMRAADPTISYPLAARDSVPMANAVVYPFIALLISLVAVEFCLMRGKQTATMSVQAFIHVLCMAIVGFAVVLAVTETTKPMASRFRPDFLARCRPKNVTADGRPIRPDDPVPNILTLCTGAMGGDNGINDGRKSFPSGHSSNTLSLCWYCMLYLIHALYYRGGYVYMGGLFQQASKGWLWRLLLELLQGLTIIWVCTVVSIAWWVGVSRYMDSRHNIDDILGGFMVALLWMTPISLISMAHLSFYHQRMMEDREHEVMQLPISSSNGQHIGTAAVPAVDPIA